MAGTRKAPVVEFELPITKETAPFFPVLDILREALGRVSSLVVVPFVMVETLMTNSASGAGTVVAASRTALDFEDAKLDSFRVVAYAGSTATGAQLVVRDVTDSPAVELCRVAIPATAARAVGDWTQLARRPSGERSIECAVIGDGVADQTLYNVQLHARTTHFR